MRLWAHDDYCFVVIFRSLSLSVRLRFLERWPQRHGLCVVIAGLLASLLGLFIIIMQQNLRYLNCVSEQAFVRILLLFVLANNLNRSNFMLHTIEIFVIHTRINIGKYHTCRSFVECRLV